MSIKHGLLALLERGPMHGYQLKTAFEESTGGTWPLNIGQVYTTLGRLERDGLVESLPEHDGQREYEITDAGRAELAMWFATPVSRTDRPRDELTIKLALAVATPGVDVRAVLQGQRTATVRTMQEYTRLKASSDKRSDLSWRLVVEAMLFQAEAEIRWLDHCETTLARYQPETPAAAVPTPEPGQTAPDRTAPAGTAPERTARKAGRR
ncbi:PadR family transcriptional regulator [Rugosimonospora africana]|uniref:Transcriptional regulator n=1 Tax=Rugosimonospora africana TaxID=556532 RepID=A0A8J3QNM5_9ACTN|nr:PadR family transcriptional regulator [Rugosimonospora africana]GIH12817.1 transcriptional regulator [Rugosimonospora africana]